MDHTYRNIGISVAVALTAGAISFFAMAPLVSAASGSASTSLNGSNEVPSVSTEAYGNYSSDSSNDESVNFKLDVFKIEDTTAAHLHCGKSGENGPVVVGLFESSNGVDINGTLVSGTFDNDDVADMGSCPTPIYDIQDLKKSIEKGEIYVNVHSKDFPNGEIRGQLSGSFDNENGNENNGNNNGKCEWNNGKDDCDKKGEDKDRKSPCEQHGQWYTGWDWSWNCWCDSGKPNYDKDKDGHDKKKGSSYSPGNWNSVKSGKDGKDGKDGYSSGKDTHDWQGDDGKKWLDNKDAKDSDNEEWSKREDNDSNHERKDRDDGKRGDNKSNWSSFGAHASALSIVGKVGVRLGL